MSEITLEIKYLKNGCGFKAHCSACGKLIHYASGCNRAGLIYAEAAAKGKFEEHKAKCKALKARRK